MKLGPDATNTRDLETAVAESIEHFGMADVPRQIQANQPRRSTHHQPVLAPPTPCHETAQDPQSPGQADEPARDRPQRRQAGSAP